jgi:hypothetical protein
VHPSLDALLRILSGESERDSVIRVVGHEEDPESAIVSFLIGQRLLPCIAMRISTPEGYPLARLKIPYGVLSAESPMSLMRVQDFLDGKYLHLEPKAKVDLSDSGEIWIEFDSNASYFKKPDVSTNDEVARELANFYFQALEASSDIDEWFEIHSIDAIHGGFHSESGISLQDPTRDHSLSSFSDQTDIDILIDREISTIFVPSQPDLRFSSIDDASAYLGEHYPESLTLECEYDGARYFLDATLKRIQQKVFGWDFGISMTIE